MRRLLVGFVLAYLLGLALILTWDFIEANRYQLIPIVSLANEYRLSAAAGCTVDTASVVFRCDRFRLR